MVEETARSLVAFLQMKGSPVAVIDPSGNQDRWPDVSWIDLAKTDRLRIDAACLRGGAMVPMLWLEDFQLISITGAGPDQRYGVAAILATQADLLGASSFDDLASIYEAHRLLAADLNIACGTKWADVPTSESWWAASSDDVSLEYAIATAAGVRPEVLPQLRYLARHEIMRSIKTSRESWTLEGHAVEPLTVRATRMRMRLHRLAHMLREDVGLAAANLHRIPQFIERRRPGALSFLKGAS